MNKIYYIIFLFFITNELYSQDYYPLHNSNVWNYSISGTNKKVTVISDSLFQNGKSYSILSDDDIVGGKYVRADSQFVYYYDPVANADIPFFKLNGKVGDFTEVKFRSYLKVHISQIDSTTLFNKKIHYISYLIESTTITKVTLSDKFGPTSASYYDDPPPPWPKYTYSLIGCEVNGTKYGNVVSVQQENRLPGKFVLSQNYPNPFNPTTTITYSLPKSSFVILKIYNLLGREITTLVNGEKRSGTYKVTWDAQNVPSGVYFYKITAGEYSNTKKMILLK